MNGKKEAEMSEILMHIKKAFKYMRKIKKIDRMLVNDWLFDQLEYPDIVADYIKEIKSRLPDPSNASTLISGKA